MSSGRSMYFWTTRSDSFSQHLHQVAAQQAHAKPFDAYAGLMSQTFRRPSMVS